MLKIFQICAVLNFSIYNKHVALSAAFPVFSEHARATSVTTFRSRTAITALYMQPDDESVDYFDLESARTKLEALVGASGGSSSFAMMPEEPSSPSLFVSIPSPEFAETYSMPEKPVLDIKLPPRPPLTTIERERRLAEIQLLAHLNDGDEPVNDILELWFAERGPRAAGLLRRADDLINEGHEEWGEAESILRSLIEEYGVYFAEPINRLATLYYLQGRLEESLTLNKMVLGVKPWHFGALSHIVMVYAALGDSNSARQWAAFRLPMFSHGGSNRRRTRWVERVVVEATGLLHTGEKNLSKVFGDSDKSWIETRQQKVLDLDDDAWQ